MRTNRPAAHRATRPTARIAAVAITLALIVTSVVIALAAFAAGAYPHRSVEEPAPATAPASRTEAPARPGEPSSAGLLDPSVGRGAGSRVCTASPSSPRCRLEGGSGMSYTRGGHAMRPATDGPETLLKGEWDETGPADMPGRVPGRGGWVSEEGPCRA